MFTMAYLGRASHMAAGAQSGSARRNPPLTDDREAGYAGACHRAASCADPLD
jgi:hypothetical protein